MLRIGILAPIVLDLVSLCTFESSWVMDFLGGQSRCPLGISSPKERHLTISPAVGFAGVKHIFWVKHDGVWIFCRMSRPTDTIDYMPMYIF